MTARALRVGLLVGVLVIAAAYFVLTRRPAEVPVGPRPEVPVEQHQDVPVEQPPEAPVGQPPGAPAAHPSEAPVGQRPPGSAKRHPAISGNYSDDWMKTCGPVRGPAQKTCTADLDAAYGRAAGKPVPAAPGDGAGTTAKP